MSVIEDELTMRHFIDCLEAWGCMVLSAVNRPNPHRGGFSITFRCEDETARAIAALGIVTICVDLRSDTYVLRLPDVNLSFQGTGQPHLLPWTEESKQERLSELLAMWKAQKDILGGRKQRLSMMYRKDGK